jgi:type IV pilus assembly protein PilW
MIRIKISMPGYKNPSGFTLMEVLVSMTIGLVVLAGVASTFTFHTRQNNAEEQIVQMQQNVRGALDLMVREIQMAGYKPAGGTFNGIQTSTSTTLRIKLDLNASGNETDDSTDDITYAFDNSTGVLTRTLNNPGSSATLGDNLTAFTFTYLDANGASTTTNTAVRRITINVTARTAKPDPSFPSNGGYRTYQLSADITPPNLAL